MKQLYQSMVSTALYLKQQIETMRSSNLWGALLWQLNEIWPTGGWGSLEYGTPGAGQVVGGRWKPLHYWLANLLFADVLISCGTVNGATSFADFALVCFAKNDHGALGFDGTATVEVVHHVQGEDLARYEPCQCKLPFGPTLPPCIPSSCALCLDLLPAWILCPDPQP
jgi:beta-mannosidase